MEHGWILTFDKYSGLAAKAADLISKEISSRIDYVLPAKEFALLTAKEKETCDIVLLGISGGEAARSVETALRAPEIPDGYSIYAGESVFGNGRRMIAIAGSDERGLLYGCVDFINKHSANVGFSAGAPMAEIVISEAPAIKTRAVWTWGHVIYDYRGFFDNMLRLRLNEIIIWNDRLPLNADEVMKYAHSLGIKVIWGFAWGWSTSCKDTIGAFDKAAADKLKNDIIRTFETE